LILFCLSFRLLAQDPPPLIKYSFGPQLSFTTPVFRIDSNSSRTGSGQKPDIRQVQGVAFDRPYTSWIQQLLRDPWVYTFWVRFQLENHSDSALALSIYCGDLNYTDGWWASPGHPLQQISGGSLRSPIPGSSLIQRTYNILPLLLAPRQSGELFLALRQRARLYYFNGIQIYSQDALATSYAKDYEQDYADSAFQWLFQGFLLCQLFYMLVQWLIIRRKEYLYYLGYIAVISLYFLSKFETQLGLPLLFTRFPLLKIYCSKTLLILPYFLYFRFIRHYLELPAQYPALNKWIIRIEYFLLFYMVFDAVFILLTFDQRTQNYVFTYVLLLVFLLSASFIIYLFRHRQTLIYFVLTGSLFVAVGNILGQVFTYFQDYNHLELGITNILIFPQIGVLLEILCFTAGLGYKNHISEKEKIRSQENLIEQLKANELLQQRVQHIRNKIAQDLHDDIGSTLSSISILSDLALKNNSGYYTLETMSEIKDSSILLMERMDDIVWSINPRNDSLENLLMRVRHFATTLFEARDIEYIIEIQDNIHKVKLPMDYRQHIYLVLKEGINNLVKYAGASQAALRVGFDHQYLELCVRDNGRGFDASSTRMGNGIIGMQHRADLMKAELIICSVIGEGTSITLKVDIR
jgi:signal transduction histidine kinase